jgi:hypothetical protein
MSDLFDYLHWRGDLSFTQDPANAVDALIFSALSYITLPNTAENSGLPLSHIADDYLLLPESMQNHRVKKDLELLKAVAATKRFGSCNPVHFRERIVREEETQFSAITFLLDDGTAFVTFRGTDYTLVGWKEDFNMAFQQTVPSQRLAQAYLQEIAETYPRLLRIGGHSKGGNLAVYAAVRVPQQIQRRILSVYNHDGPGFNEYHMEDPAYRQMVPKIHTFVPQSSVIGMLLEHEEPYTIIKSKQIGILQHEPYSWEVDGPSFVFVEEISANSRYLDMTIKNWLAQMSMEERNEVVDTLFDLLSMGNVDNVQDIIQPRNIRNYLWKLVSNGRARRILSTEFFHLVEAAKATQRMVDQKQQNHTIP